LRGGGGKIRLLKHSIRGGKKKGKLNLQTDDVFFVPYKVRLFFFARSRPLGGGGAATIGGKKKRGLRSNWYPIPIFLKKKKVSFFPAGKKKKKRGKKPDIQSKKKGKKRGSKDDHTVPSLEGGG